LSISTAHHSAQQIQPSPSDQNRELNTAASPSQSAQQNQCNVLRLRNSNFAFIFIMLAVFFGIVVFANIYMICSPILTQLCWIFGIGMVLALVAVYYATKPRDD
jgi:hypothetical protein